MSAFTKIAKNTSVLWSIRIIEPLINFLLVVTIARLLGAEGLGKYSFVLALQYIFQSIANLGMDPLVVREVSKDPSQLPKYFNNGIAISSTVSGLLIIVLNLFMYILGYDMETRLATLIISISFIPSTVTAFSESVFVAYEKMEYCAVLVLGETVLKAVLGVGMLKLGFGLIELISLITILRVAAAGASIITVKKRIARFPFTFNWVHCKEIGKFAPTFGLISLFSILYWRVDIMMLSKMAGMEQLGIYSAAYRFFAIAMVIPQGYSRAIFPVISRFAGEAIKRFGNGIATSTKYLAIVIFPVTAAICILSDQIIPIFFGNKYLESILALKLLTLGLLPYAFVRLLATIMIAGNQQRIDLRINIAGTLVNVVLNALLIPRLGYIGAALATIISLVFFLGAQLVWLRTQISLSTLLASLAKPFLGAVAMVLVMLKLSELNVFLAASAGLLAYGAALMVLKTISKNELQIFEMS